MAATLQFQLFPPPPPKINLPKPPNRSRKTPFTSDSVQLDTLVSSHEESVVIRIIEDPDETASQHHVSGARSRTPSAELARETVPASPIDGHRPFPITTSPPPRSVRSGSVTLIRSDGSNASQRSPVVPMRSMFPTYNPNVSLHQQRYFPQRISNFQTENVSREDYGSSVASPSRLDNALGGPKTAPASIINFPADVLALKETHVSSVRELEKLWKATNGYEPDSTLGSFDLKMSRNDDATFNFGSTPTQPFYTLETYDTHELCISRTHPRKPTKNIPILLLSIEAAGRRLPPNDGLVTFIFPKLAAMLAIDQSTQLAAQHHLAPTLRDEMQADAVQRAAAQEACHLKWNENERRYELAHPAIGRDPNEEINPDPSPPTPDESEKPVLHITVSSHALASPMSVSAAPPVILVTNPNRSSSSQPSAPAELRMSTVPLHDAEEPLASLDFGSMILHVSAAQILELMPSLYAIDSIVSAIFAVAVADEATNPIMARMDLWIPRPKAPGSIFGGSVAGKSYAGSVLYATIAEREEAEEEAKLMRQLHEKDTKGKSAKKSLWAKSKKKKKQTKQIVIGEFDLEKYGHYQGGSREGQELPGVVRGALEAMFVGLRFIVWMLTTAVQVIAWVMVGLTRCLTSEKF